jgi:secondary thiamine-phosphate synthase enzyme
VYNVRLPTRLEHQLLTARSKGVKKNMASASVKALEQPAAEVVSGAYRVFGSVAKVKTEGREELYNLTESARDFVRASGIRAGSLTISSMHTTSAIFINEWQEALVHDVKSYLASLVGKDAYYRHNDPNWSDCDRHNADSHLRSLMLGVNLTLQIWDGDIVLGEWQSIIMAELDGPRERTIRFQAMGVACQD